MTFHYVGIPQHWSSFTVTMWTNQAPQASKVMQPTCREAGGKWGSLENLSRECLAFVSRKTFLVSVVDFLFCCVLWEILLALCGSPGLGLCMKLVMGKESEGSFSAFDLICILSPFLVRWYLLIHQKWMKKHVTPWNRFPGVVFFFFSFCSISLVTCSFLRNIRRKLIQAEIWVAKLEDWEQFWIFY